MSSTREILVFRAVVGGTRHEGFESGCGVEWENSIATEKDFEGESLRRIMGEEYFNQ